MKIAQMKVNLVITSKPMFMGEGPGTSHRPALGKHWLLLLLDNYLKEPRDLILLLYREYGMSTTTTHIAQALHPRQN